MSQVSQLLLEFLHKYVAEVVSDAAVYQEHAGKPEVDIDDLRLAIQVGCLDYAERERTTQAHARARFMSSEHRQCERDLVLSQAKHGIQSTRARARKHTNRNGVEEYQHRKPI